MLCEIAELIVEVPETGGLAPRCQQYQIFGTRKTDIVIDSKQYRYRVWPTLNENDVCYMESGVQFYNSLIEFDGIMLHASAVAYEGRAYLFSGPCGMGKSTHTRLWQSTFGGEARVFNDDKPALRKIDGVWFAYGTPWCGKDGINQNLKTPVAGICFLERGEENEIRQLTPIEAIAKVVGQTRRKFWVAEKVDLMLKNVEQLVNDIPIFVLKNNAKEEAAKLSYHTMLCKAEELGL